MKRLIANPFENQNIILSTFERIRTPQVSIEKEPMCFLPFINEYCEINPTIGMNVITIVLEE